MIPLPNPYVAYRDWSQKSSVMSGCCLFMILNIYYWLSITGPGKEMSLWMSSWSQIEDVCLQFCWDIWRRVMHTMDKLWLVCSVWMQSKSMKLAAPWIKSLLPFERGDSHLANQWEWVSRTSRWLFRERWRLVLCDTAKHVSFRSHPAFLAFQKQCRPKQPIELCVQPGQLCR